MRAAARNSVLIKTTNLKKFFELKKGVFSKSIALVRAVDGIDLEILRGETLGLVGESGCGKTTLGQLLLRMEDPSEGGVFFETKDILGYNDKQMRELRRELQIVFQDPFSSLDPRKTIGYILEEPFAIHNIGSKNERKEWVRRLLQDVDLSPESANRFPHEFSGGQRQRICIARALALNPKFIVCDEAVSSLDVSIQAQIINLLLKLQEQHGLTYLFISHDLNVVEHVSDRIAVMYLGRIVELGPAEVFSRPKIHPYTSALLSANPEPDPFLKRKKIVLKGEIPSPINPPPGCHFHPRCPRRVDKCDQRAAKLVEIEPGHFVRCFLYHGKSEG